jgi:TonB-linked SusC/RagA family outer membrane protein
MGGESLVPRFCRALTGVVALVLFTSVAGAQNAVFSGRVTSQAGQPLGGASVGITELGVGGIADGEGRYNFTVDAGRVGGRSVNLTARYIGYKPKRLPITLTSGSTQHDFVLERDILSLEEVVVTGTSEAMSKTKTAFSVGVVDNSQMKDVPASSPLGALEGRIPGASILTQSGQPGGEPAIRLRSATSLTGRTDPLIILDGTITTLGLADVNSEDVERVEVIKGAAASSLYGSNAANGVIQIFTKRGANLAEGQTTFLVRNEYGANDLPKTLPGNMHHNYKVLKDANDKVIDFDYSAGGDRQTKENSISDEDYPRYFDQFGKIFKPGDFLTNYVSVGQRRGTTNFNASFQNTRESGVIKQLEGFKRQNFRMNIDQALTDNIDLGMGAFYGRSHSDQGEFAFPWFGMRFLEPDIPIDSTIDANGTYWPNINRPPLSGNVSNPLYVTQQHKEGQNRDRFTGTFRGAYRALSWLTAEGNIGYDKSNQSYKTFTPLGYIFSNGSESSGSIFEQSVNGRSYNLNASLTASRTFSSVRNTTKLAFLYEDQLNDSLAVNAPALAVSRVPEFAAASQDPNNPIAPASRTEAIRNRNAFIVTTFDIKDRYILDALIRQDESSLFGADERTAIYHRLSAAYRVSEDFVLPGVDEFKLRVSHGTAGLRPIYDAQYEVFAVIAGQPEKVGLGNTKLKPAFSRETEYGFNVNFLKNYTLEYSYSTRRTADQIMQVPLSSATGYQYQWQNAATLDGHTHELAVGAVLLSKADYFWRLNLTADRSRSKVADLRVPAFFIGPDLNTRMFHIGKGEPLGVIYGDKWIRTQAQLEETIRAGKLAGTVADYQVNEEGYYVSNANFHTLAESPLKAWKCESSTTCATPALTQIIGDVNPDFNLGLSTNATWRSLNFSGVVTWVKGGNIYNLTRQWPFNELRDVAIDQSGKAKATLNNDGVTPCPLPSVNPTCAFSTGKKPTNYYNAFYNGISPNEFFVENGTYVRLRELAVSWNLPAKWVAKIPAADFRTARLGLVGRNLWTNTDYSGYNPDVSAVTGPGGGNPFVYRVDYFTYPAFRTFSAMFELGF